MNSWFKVEQKKWKEKRDFCFVWTNKQFDKKKRTTDVDDLKMKTLRKWKKRQLGWNWKRESRRRNKVTSWNKKRNRKKRERENRSHSKCFWIDTKQCLLWILSFKMILMMMMICYNKEEKWQWKRSKAVKKRVWMIVHDCVCAWLWSSLVIFWLKV